MHQDGFMMSSDDANGHACDWRGFEMLPPLFYARWRVQNRGGIFVVKCQSQRRHGVQPAEAPGTFA